LRSWPNPSLVEEKRRTRRRYRSCRRRRIGRFHGSAIAAQIYGKACARIMFTYRLQPRKDLYCRPIVHRPADPYDQRGSHRYGTQLFRGSSTTRSTHVPRAQRPFAGGPPTIMNHRRPRFHRTYRRTIISTFPSPPFHRAALSGKPGGEIDRRLLIEQAPSFGLVGKNRPTLTVLIERSRGSAASGPTTAPARVIGPTQGWADPAAARSACRSAAPTHLPWPGRSWCPNVNKARKVPIPWRKELTQGQHRARAWCSTALRDRLRVVCCWFIAPHPPTSSPPARAQHQDQTPSSPPPFRRAYVGATSLKSYPSVDHSLQFHHPAGRPESMDGTAELRSPVR